jgi:hypothetical protein
MSGGPLVFALFVVKIDRKAIDYNATVVRIVGQFITMQR